MSTSAVLSSQDTSAAMPIKNDTITFAVVVKLNDQSKIESVRHTSSEKDIAKLEASDYVGGEVIAFKQVVQKPTAGTLDGFFQLVPDTETQLDIINKGINAKFNQKIRTTLIEQDDAGNLVFQPTDAAYDATALIQAASERTYATPFDKALKAIANLDPAMKAAILAQLQAVAAA